MQDLIDAARADIRLGTAEGGRVCLTSSFQAECVVLTHLMIQEYPDVPVLFLDTGYHFPETYEYRDEIARIFNLKLVNLAPRQTVAEQESAFGILYQSAPDRCCAMRKVDPLFAGLADYDGLTGAVNLSYTLLGSTRFGFEFNRDVQYSYDVNQPYYLQTRLGGSIAQQIFGPLDLVAVMPA